MVPPESAAAADVCRWAIDTFGDKFAVVTSFQAEGMVVLDIAARISSNVRVVTLDTGRMPGETYEMVETVRKHYGVRIEMVQPDSREVGQMVTLHGPNLFYQSVPQRMLCCQIRKVRPLQKKLEKFQAYAVGLRRGQSETREAQPKVDHSGDVYKLSPLADWTKEEVDQYIRRHEVPRHPLYDRGYTSIGCGPCTRATVEGESERAGRWWWENEADKECGIHFTPDGRAVRDVDLLLSEILKSNA
jgi:phosphoadenosine phosphosulfate reductase